MPRSTSRSSLRVAARVKNLNPTGAWQFPLQLDNQLRQSRSIPARTQRGLTLWGTMGSTLAAGALASGHLRSADENPAQHSKACRDRLERPDLNLPTRAC